LEVAIPNESERPSLDISEGLEELEAVLTEPARLAFGRLSAVAAAERIGANVIVRKSDVEILLIETIVSVGYEVDLEAAKAVIARLVEMVHDADKDGTIAVRKVRALLVAYYGDEGIPKD
jgi:hypothetical protein